MCALLISLSQLRSRWKALSSFLRTSRRIFWIEGNKLRQRILKRHFQTSMFLRHCLRDNIWIERAPFEKNIQKIKVRSDCNKRFKTKRNLHRCLYNSNRQMMTCAEKFRIYLLLMYRGRCNDQFFWDACWKKFAMKMEQHHKLHNRKTIVCHVR